MCFQGVKILHNIGITVASSTLHKEKKNLIKKQEENISQTMSQYVESHYLQPNQRKHGIEVLGDNLDVTITPAKMTMSSQRKSLHWFLTIVKEKKIVVDDVNMDNIRDERNVLKLHTSSWLPSTDEINTFVENTKFHVLKALTTYIDFLKPLKACLPSYIVHEFIEKTKKKSTFLNCDLVDESENSSQGMIAILQKVNKLVFPTIEQDKTQSVASKIVFGGDVLTNERAFSAQEAMQNGNSEYDMLGGLIHRPEGLHREMNFLLVTCSVG